LSDDAAKNRLRQVADGVERRLGTKRGHRRWRMQTTR
jgi:hypothetical protein